MIRDEVRKELLETVHERTFSLNELSRAEGKDGDEYEVAFSSEIEVERGFGIEVLDHDPQSAILDRLNSGGAVLVNHDVDDMVGVVVEGSARIDDDRRGRARLRFSRSARGQEIKLDVDDRIRQNVSFRYTIERYEVEERDGLPDMVRITRWRALEISFVAIPADASVGVARDLESEIDEETMREIEGSTAQTDEPDSPASEIRDNEESEMTKETEVVDKVDAAAERAAVRTAEKKRCESIRSMASEHDCHEIGAECIDSETSVEDAYRQILAEVGKRNNAARAEKGDEIGADGEVDLSDGERSQFSLVRLMDALANPKDLAAQDRAGFELEVSAAATRGFGDDFKCRGAFVPTSILAGVRADQYRALNVTTPTDGPELVGTSLLAGEYVEALRNASAVLQAGARFLPGLVGNVDIPRQTSGAVAAWIDGEDGDAAESEAQFDQIQLRPKDIACYTEATRRLLQQSTPGVDGIIRDDLIAAQALGTDLGALNGTGANGQPTGIVNQTGVGAVSFTGLNPTWAELVAMIRTVKQGNALTGSPSWLMEALSWAYLSSTTKTAGDTASNFMLNPDSDRLVGYQYRDSEQVTDNQMIFGDFSQVLVAEWGGIEISVDPFTHSLKGRIRYVMFRTSDVALRRPTHFCVGNQ